MTIPEIWKMLNRITPNKPVYELACSMASLDTQVIIDLIEKYTGDQEMTNQQIKQELIKQRIKRKPYEF